VGFGERSHMGVAPDDLDDVADDLERVLEETDDLEARYHIREAAQRVVIAEWERERDAETTGA